MPFNPRDAGEPDGRMTVEGWKAWSNRAQTAVGPTQNVEYKVNERSSFWDVEHWCGPTSGEQVKRTLHWDDTRKWRWCPSCHWAMNTETRNDIDPAICAYGDGKMFCVLLAGHGGGHLGYERD